MTIDTSTFLLAMTAFVIAFFIHVLIRMLQLVWPF